MCNRDGRNTIAKFFTDTIQLDYLLFLKIIGKYIKRKVPTDISRFHLIWFLGMTHQLIQENHHLALLFLGPIIKKIMEHAFVRSNYIILWLCINLKLLCSKVVLKTCNSGKVMLHCNTLWIKGRYIFFNLTNSNFCIHNLVLLFINFLHLYFGLTSQMIW